MSTLIKSAKLTFSSKVKFITDKEIKETMDDWGLDSVEQVAEELDAIGFISVSLEEKDGEPCTEEGYLFVF